jgi:hypothetical protein
MSYRPSWPTVPDLSVVASSERKLRSIVLALRDNARRMGTGSRDLPSRAPKLTALGLPPDLFNTVCGVHCHGVHPVRAYQGSGVHRTRKTFRTVDVWRLLSKLANEAAHRFLISSRNGLLA